MQIIFYLRLIVRVFLCRCYQRNLIIHIFHSFGLMQLLNSNNSTPIKAKMVKYNDEGLFPGDRVYTKPS